MTAPGTPAEPRPSAPGTDPFATGAAPHGTDAPASTPPATTRSGTPSRARSAGRTAGLGLALALLIAVTVILVLFVVFNGQTVQISLVFTDVQAPLVLALLIAAALGALIASLAGAVVRARRRNR
ncbi:putative integral membrane protein [Geodermatophilus bullaregiensis]|uniref:lipopolysaccharide assembly protein LapA domain-containing protein n=1 Tax=Geodermatophilus bullaregiensis TaxID=1564160 RepID=UPI00195DD9BE|nr:lipopolysaccharide assembly protein LapA domain-containing protein [Geodermatophilus bullaregiensis]MBM7806299.1 putative integral membrane protein [Geodermatophilus bullaregiensis]